MAGDEAALTPETLLERAGKLVARGRDGEAPLMYYRATIESERQGHWLDRTTAPPDARQRPTILYFPQLPSAPYFERSRHSARP